MSIYNIALIVFVVALAVSLMNKSIPSLVRILLSIVVIGMLLRLVLTLL